jgi:beta-glucosidase
MTVKIDVENSGNFDGEEVVQLYVKDVKSNRPISIRSLKGFERINLKKGEKRTMIFQLKPADFVLVSNENQLVIEAGAFVISVGGKQPTTLNHKKQVVSKTIVLKSADILTN